MNDINIYPGLTFHDLENGFLVILLYPLEHDSSWWATIVMDRTGAYNIMRESIHTVRHLSSRLAADSQVEKVC